jgi:adenylyltransferase/sulfurtransferase
MCPFFRFLFQNSGILDRADLEKIWYIERFVYWVSFGPLVGMRRRVFVFEQVLIAGVGALGSEVAKNVGMLGCKSVFMADPDVVERRNIGRSIPLCQRPTVGQNKISNALDRLQTWFPQTRWDGASVEIADVDPNQLSTAQILFSCVDTELARTEIAALGARYGLAICDAGLGGTSTRVGRVSWFPGVRSAACFACLLSSRRRAALLSMWESEVHACWASDEGEGSTNWTSTPTMASIVAGLQVETAMSTAGKGVGEAFSLHLDLDRPAVSRTIDHRRSAGCPFHEDVPGELFPICTLAECSDCGNLHSPNRRIGWLRRWGACPSCHSSNLTVRKSSRHQPAGSPR